MPSHLPQAMVLPNTSMSLLCTPGATGSAGEGSSRLPCREEGEGGTAKSPLLRRFGAFTHLTLGLWSGQREEGSGGADGHQPPHADFLSFLPNRFFYAYSLDGRKKKIG